jgi:hypothetical protein
MALPTLHVPGPCSLTYDSVALGKTKSGVFINTTENWISIFTDAYGRALADAIFGARTCLVRASLIDKSKLTALFGKVVGSAFDDADSQIGLTIANSGDDDLGKSLTITEADAETWTAANAVLIHPRNLNLASTQELNTDVNFLIVGDESGDFFQTVPSYY